MKRGSLSAEVVGLHTEVLDHAQDFIGIVSRAAPREYRGLLESAQFEPLLDEKGNFNHGKLYVYAEYRVFQREFKSRFPQATEAACINAFSGLFLKNDISITNLIRLIEGKDQLKQLQLDTSPD